MTIDATIRSANVLATGHEDKDLWTVLFRPNHVPFLLLAFECRAEDGDEAEEIFKAFDHNAEVVHTSLGDTEDAFKDYESYQEEASVEDCEEGYVYKPDLSILEDFK